MFIWILAGFAYLGLGMALDIFLAYKNANKLGPRDDEPRLGHNIFFWPFVLSLVFVEKSIDIYDKLRSQILKELNHDKTTHAGARGEKRNLHQKMD